MLTPDSHYQVLEAARAATLAANAALGEYFRASYTIADLRRAIRHNHSDRMRDLPAPTSHEEFCAGVATVLGSPWGVPEQSLWPWMTADRPERMAEIALLLMQWGEASRTHAHANIDYINAVAAMAAAVATWARKDGRK